MHSQPVPSTTHGTHNRSLQSASAPPIPSKPIAAPASTPSSIVQKAKITTQAGAASPAPKPPASSAIPPAVGSSTGQPTGAESTSGNALATDQQVSQDPKVVKEVEAAKEPGVQKGAEAKMRTTVPQRGQGGKRGVWRGKPKVQADKDKS